TIPYPHERGDISLRQRLSRFLDIYCHYAVEPESIFIGPERSQLLAMVLSMVTEPDDRVLLSRSLESVYAPLLMRSQRELIRGNDDLAELLELDNALTPRVILIAPEQLGKASPITMQALCEQARAHPERWYLIDDSGNFDISSDLNSNMNLRMAAQMQMPPNLLFLFGLVKNTVCPDLELSFLLNAPQDWIAAFDVASELTYSRIAYPSQLYYEWLFDDLLSFPFPASGANLRQIACGSPTLFTERFVAAAKDPVFDEKPISLETPDLIRLDYGEFEAPVPDTLVKGIIKGFLEDPGAGLDQLVVSRVASYMKSTRHVPVEPERIVLSQGVFPLFGAMISTLARRLGRPPVIGLPDGSYGPIAPTVSYHGGRAVRISTEAENGFQVEAGALAKIPERLDLLWLTQPSNPSGLFYRSEQLLALFKWLRQSGTYLLADEIFFLLSDYRLGTWTPRHLSTASFMKEGYQDLIFLTDGISKAFAAGGMRLGFMVCPDSSWQAEIQAALPLPPKSSLRAWDALYSAFVDEASFSHDVSGERDQVQKYLCD
ncbi:MAG TPA: aminotransferase class I/II-fold pyridoxal phosphate-dependent enzyme, partial [Chroococcales cyanobacterium]